MSRIAIVGRDARIYAVDTDAPGGELQALTPAGMRCAWPTWSPDGGTLAYSAYPSAGSNGQGAFRIMTQTPGGSARTAYANEPGTDAIAHHTPHYVMWSPDGARLAFIAQRLGAGLTLMAGDVDGAAADPLQLLSGGPLYFCWARDSRRILAHAREVHYLIDLDDPTAAQVPVASLGYMAPSASPTDDLVAICGEIADGAQALLIARIDGAGIDMAGEIAGAVGFSWSPRGEYLAIASELNRATGYYGALSLLDVRTFEERLLLEEALLCFFWSPDGGRIAYIAPSDGADGSVRWGVLDLASGERRYIADFQPSREQLTMFLFFDQYSQSHALWSPDGRRLLFAGALGWLETRAELPDSGVSSVYAMDVDAGGEVALIGEGTLGVWSA